MNDFEKQLRRQPLRSVPPEWRREILQAALGTTHPQQPAWWRQLLWPCPQAWAGIAAVWLVVIVLNFATSEQSAPTSAVAITRPSPEMQALLREQRLLIAELLNPPEPPLANRPKNLPPKPRSENRPAMVAV